MNYIEAHERIKELEAEVEKLRLRPPDRTLWDGSVSDFDMSPELKELLENTPILTDEDISELTEANRKLGLTWWQRLLEILKQNENGDSRVIP